jgi:hypothetical protein
MLSVQLENLGNQLYLFDIISKYCICKLDGKYLHVFNGLGDLTT